MNIYVARNNKLVEVDSDVLSQIRFAESVVWIDSISPNEEERKLLEQFLSVEIPTKEDVQEIESSSRLYQEGDALVMTINVVKKENGNHKMANITFLLKENILLTLRYDDPTPFESVLKLNSVKITFPVNNSISLLLGMLEIIIDKIADTLENISATVESLSQKIFTEETRKNHHLAKVLISMGVQGEINSKTRDSLSSINRMLGFLKFNLTKDEELHFENRIEPLILDAYDLKDHSAFLGHKINFILDASLGLINIEQNTIIKIFSIAAVVLLPPTLIASIYGMNFKFMPELAWVHGYPIAIILMLLSAIIPYLYFKKKGWL